MQMRAAQKAAAAATPVQQRTKAEPMKEQMIDQVKLHSTKQLQHWHFHWLCIDLPVETVARC